MCVDPVTAALVVSGIATVGQGVAAYAEGQATDKAMKQAARQELTAGAIEETNIRKSSREFLSKQRVQGLASGVDISSGSFDALATEDAKTLEVNALMRRYEGELASDQLKFQGRQAQRAGTMALGTSILSAGADALSGVDQFPGFKLSKGKGSISRSKTTSQGPVL